MDGAVFVLEKMKIKAGMELMDRVEKHLKDEFYRKVLPKILKEVEKTIVISMVNDENHLDLTIKIKE